MKVAVLTNRFSMRHVGGAEWSLIYICRNLISAGVDLHIISSNSDVDGLNGATAWTVSYKDTIGLINNLKTIKPDVLQVHIVSDGYGYAAIRTIKKQIPGIKIVITFHDHTLLCRGALRCFCQNKIDSSYKMPSMVTCLICQKKRVSPIFRNAVIRIINRYTDYVLFVSKDLETFYRNNKIVVKGRVLYNGIGNDAGSYLVVSEESIQQFFENRSLPYKKTIVTGGRMSSRKGYHKVIGAFAEVAKKHPDIVLAIYGGANSYTQELKHEALLTGLNERIMFLGWLSQEQLKELYQGSMLGIIPSLYPDPLPRSAYDMAASRLPIIGTNIGGLKEILVNEKTGLLCQMNSVEQLSSCLELLVNNNELRCATAEAAFLKVSGEVFSAKFNAHERIKIYKELIEEPA